MGLMAEEEQAKFRTALARPSRAAAAAQARGEMQAAAQEEALQATLARRQWLGGEPGAAEAAIYQSKVADDKRRLRAKFQPVVEAQEEGDNTWRSPLATRSEAWCKKASWVACEQCHRLEKRPLREAHITGKKPASHTIKHCAHCKAGVGYMAVGLADIPEVLRHLSPAALWALRPLELDVGRPVWAKHGYRVHTDMVRFWWRPNAVQVQMDMLERAEDQEAAAAAFAHLMGDPESAYRKFVEMHGKFLRRNAATLTGDPLDRQLQLPRRALEEEGLECAVWPHLYPRLNMCETYIRKADVRRRDRAAAKRPGSALLQHVPSSPESSDGEDDGVAKQDMEEEAPCEASSAEEEDEEDLAEAEAPLDFARPGRNSAKSAYLAKVLRPVLGYGATYELFQFVYDLWLWSTLGAKKHTVEAPLRLAMAVYSFSPEYWHTRHAALVDMVKQLGLPTLFLTVAPYEWSFPFHAWVEDEAAKLLRARLKLPVAETLHIAHVLAQAVQGLLTGANRKEADGNRRAWKSHVFAAKDGSGRKTVLNFFGRLEYQDGKRKRYVNQEEAATQFYHGRGTVHLHLLVWLQHIEAVKLEDAISASVPEENEVLEGSQRSWTGSGWPLEPKPPHYDAEAGILRLHHSEDDFCRHKENGTPEGIRAYVVDLLSSLQCHIDVQMSDGRGMLPKYVSGYVPKFSDSFTTEWLNDAGSDYAVAKRVLTDYHPLEPEMTLQLAMQWFPQCFAGGTLQRFRVPVPWDGLCPDRVQQYMASPWRRSDMTLAEFLRKTNQKGGIHKALRKRHREFLKGAADQEILEEPLEAWANHAHTKGEVALAAMYLSRYNDCYYGQWVLMNVPFQGMDDLKRPELDLVPDHLFYQALALLLNPEHWTDPAAIRAELELEAFREYHIKNILAMISANQSLIKQYLDGTLDKRRDAIAAAGDQVAARGAGAGLGRGNVQLSRQQQQIANEILECVQAGMQQRQAQEDAWKGEGPELSEDLAGQNEHWEPAPAASFPSPAGLRSALAVLGPAGSGKTTAVHAAIGAVHAKEGRVLLVAPTGRLAATMREKFPHLEVDTIHGAFLVYKPVHETLEIMLPYDLVVVEEVGQLSREIFERIMQQWEAADRVPTLVFVGDFYQLPAVDPSSALDSWMWHNVMVKKRSLNTMLRCKCPKLRKTLEVLRTNKPTVEQLREIMAGHKAPSLGRGGYIMNEEPSLDDVGHILAETPATLFLTVSRRAAAYINDLVVQVLLGNEVPLGVVPADPESNIENYVDGKMVDEQPLEIPIFAGARTLLTKNLNKPIGFVNGMGATVVAMDGSNVIVKTDQGARLAVHPWTSEKHVVHYPLRLGYASTLHKVQGATLPHATVWLDVCNMPAAAYVALGRMEFDLTRTGGTLATQACTTSPPHGCSDRRA